MMPKKKKTKRSTPDRPEFFELYASGDAEVRRRLEEQFLQLSRKLSLVNQLLIESKKLATQKEEFQRFHNMLLDSEFRSAFGITAIVIVYLYKLKETDFDRVYIPEAWDENKRQFMESAIRDLKDYHLSGEKPGKLKRRRHLFLDIIAAVKKGKIDQETGSYTRFIRNFEQPGRSLSFTAKVKKLFKDEMLMVTPLHNEAGEFWVTINTYISKEQSLFSRTTEDQQTALTKWYVTVHEAISECFFSVAHLLRLREKAVEHETLERVSIISYLLSHPSVKLFTTPLKNAADDLRSLDPEFPRQFKGRERFETIVDNMDLITDLWEGNLVVLEEFGAIENGGNYSLECQAIGDEWQKIEEALEKAADLLFLNHINDLYDDWNYQNMVRPILERRRLGFSNFFRLKLSLTDGPVCYGHPKLVVMHLISLLENAIEAADFTRVADAVRSGEAGDDYKNLISFRLQKTGDFALIEVVNDCRVLPHEEQNLMALNDYIQGSLKLKKGGGIIYQPKYLAERKFTTKSGSGFGWAVLLAADYFCRLQVVTTDGRKKDHGKFKIEVLRKDGSTAAAGVKTTIHLPLPVNGSEKVVVEK